MDVETCDLPCQLCNQKGLQLFEIRGSSRLWVCEKCELYQYGKVVDESAYASSYHLGYEKHRQKKIRTARIRLNRVEPLLVPADGASIKLLDVGCSVGATLEAAKRFGWDAIGVDVSQDAVRYCQQQGLNAKKVDGVMLPFESNSFDVVVNWHVVEHVADVRKTLQEWKRVLKPGGVLFMETPDAASPKVRKLGTEYRKFWAPEHTYTFTYSNLAKFLDEAGMEVVPGPWIGRIQKHGLLFAPLAIGYRSFYGLRQLAGVHKEFQIFARKNLEQPVESLVSAPCAA